MNNHVGSINLAPAEPVLQANQLDDLVQLWLDDCALRLPASTVAGYCHKLHHFRQWWSAYGPAHDWQLRQRDLTRFARELEKNSGLAYNSRKDVHRRLRQMFKWAYRQDYTDGRDYSQWVPVAEGSAPLRVAVAVASLKKLMRAASKTTNPARDRALLAMLIGTGIRRAECASLNVQDVVMDADGSGTAKVWAKKVRGREVHARPVAFDRHTGRYLQDWLTVYDCQFGPLFPSAKGGALTSVGIYKTVKAVIAKAELEHEIQGPHDLRRAFATYFARKRKGEGYDHLLSKQLGHANYHTTTLYSLQDIEDVRAAITSPFALMNE